MGVEEKSSKVTKGQEKKEWILTCSKELMYENGYHATTTRMIASRAEVNLGLFNYYFKGKVEIGSSIYYQTRNSFNNLLKEALPNLSFVDTFIYSSAIELYLCLTNSNWGKFYCDISEEPLIFDTVRNFILDAFKNYSVVTDNTSYSSLAGLSITSIKPALVRYSLSNQVEIDEYILFYIKQQLHFFGMDEELSYKYLYTLKQYNIALSKSLVPTFTLKK